MYKTKVYSLPQLQIAGTTQGSVLECSFVIVLTIQMRNLVLGLICELPRVCLQKLVSVQGLSEY